VTVIAGLLLNNVPALLGDVLITAPGLSGKKLSTPTAGNVNTFFEPQYAHVRSLRQKVNILSDKVMVAWAGSYLHARALVREMKAELDRSGRPEVISDVLRSWPEEDMKELSIIALARGEKKTTVDWCGPILHLQSSIFTKALLSGSGMEDLGALIRHMEKGDVFIDEPLPDPPKMALYALSLGSQAAGWEYVTQENLSNYWGGIVEIGMYNGGNTSKVGEALYWFWEFDITSKTLRAHSNFIKQEYQNDLLVTYTLSNDDAPRIVVVPPLLSSYSDGEKVEIAPPKLSYKWLCSCVVIRDGETTVDIFSTVEVFHDAHPIRFERKSSVSLSGGLISSSTTATIDKKYIREIEQQVGQRLGRLKSREVEREP
jgi:hypothetical protein